MRILQSWKKYRWRLPFIILYHIGQLFEQSQYTLRRWKLLLFCRAQIGEKLLVGKGCTFSVGSWMCIGKQVTIGRNCTFVLIGATGYDDQPFVVGDNTWISESFLLVSTRGVHIGKNVLIGESVSIRDSTHRYHDVDVPIREQGDEYGTVAIEDDVWIGRGCLIQGKPEGVVIGHGAILAANSVTSRSIPPLEVWGGVPARFIKKR